jgi:membrane-bound lytic murein transglycosylase MltF
MKPQDRWDSLIRYWCERYDLDWRVAKAQMLAESGGDPMAVSPAGARGLWQFMPRTWWEWWDATVGIQGPPPVVRPEDPDAATRSRCEYMRWLSNRLALQVPGQVPLSYVLAAYNWGLGNVFRVLRIHGHLPESALPSETRGYIARVARLTAATPQ